MKDNRNYDIPDDVKNYIHMIIVTQNPIYATVSMFVINS